MSDKNNALAVLITCHNRRDITLSCLQSLYKQEVDFDVYLVDDGSSDGTWESVKGNYPSVQLLKGNGNLFWVGGMQLAFSEALKNNYNYYLWLNNDTLLESDALCRLLENHRTLTDCGHSDAIVVGSLQDPVTGKLTYGGLVRSKQWYSAKFKQVEPGKEPKECETMNGNCVLIPRSVAAKVGNLDQSFTHRLGDLDYGLRSCQLGCSVWVASEYVGTCNRNPVQGSWVDTNLPLNERLQKAVQPKGFPPREWAKFQRRYSGPFWYIYWLFPYIRSVIGYRNLRTSSFRTEIE